MRMDPMCTSNKSPDDRPRDSIETSCSGSRPRNGGPPPEGVHLIEELAARAARKDLDRVFAHLRRDLPGELSTPAERAVRMRFDELYLADVTRPPFAFTGTIGKALVDVSGEAIEDLEAKRRIGLARQERAAEVTFPRKPGLSLQGRQP